MATNPTDGDQMGRRKSDRRTVQLPFEGADRRKDERRSLGDRRRTERRSGLDRRGEQD